MALLFRQWSRLIIKRISILLPQLKPLPHPPLTLPKLPHYDHLVIQQLPGEKAAFQHAVSTIENRLKQLQQGTATRVRATEMSSPAFTTEEMALLKQIEAERNHANRNNVTRTAAYAQFYRQHPEIHWALLAHMVSRNGGWNMTDLRGDLSGRFLSSEQQLNFFQFLERCNAVIFHDAYPQLLLYRESCRRRRPLFHLLPALKISAFMRPIWEYFWHSTRKGHAVTLSSLLTVAMIINEQNVIETNVLTMQPYQKILRSIPFLLQEWLHFNHLLFPVIPASQTASENWYPLLGLIMTQFANLSRRIETGRILYALLFTHTEVTKGVQRFIQLHPHTGTRSDFWPLLFTPCPTKRNHDPLRPGFPTLYSPTLATAWEEVRQPLTATRDWFHDDTSLQHFQWPITIQDVEHTQAYYHHLLHIATINPPQK